MDQAGLGPFGAARVARAAPNILWFRWGLLVESSGDLGGSSFSYDEDGRISQRANGSTWSNYYYDARGDLSAVDGGATGGTRVYDYDDAGQLTSIDYDGGSG